MGLFDKILGASTAEETLTAEEGFCAVLLAAVAADGYISDEEGSDVSAIANRARLLRDVSADRFNAIIRKLCRRLDQQGLERTMEQARESLTPDLRETAFALATDLVFSDGAVEDEERELLSTLQQSLRVPDSLALDIVRVMQVKNRG